MAHKYYCTNCARELNQDIVLLDLEPALTMSTSADERFSVLKLRVTKKDFDAMLASGTKGDLDFIHVELPFGSFAGYLSDKNNLSDAVIKGLTLEDISEFLADMRKDEFGTDDEPEDDMMNIFAPVGGPAVDESESEEPEEKVWAPAIEALRSKNTTAKGETITDQMLVDDLNRIHTLFASTGAVTLAIKPRYEKADDGDDVLIGYLARSGKKQIPVDARVCRHCDTPVFEHAGTAEHRSVAFIGEPSSGKTSTILAMTHYAKNAARNIKTNDPIWTGSYSVPGIDYIRILNVDEDLDHDLDLYAKGIAPEKTDLKSRDDAYSSTLWIQNAAGSKFILTLMDLPGELCQNDGRINGEKILTEFPVALACDAFIICFDTTQAVGGAANETIMNVCSWANEFQALRQSYKVSSIEGENEGPNKITADCFAPMMLLFTKCAELEDGALEKQEDVNYIKPDRISEIYSLKVEREFINRNEVYNDVGGLLQKYENLKDAYFSRLRSSPYGFAAPNETQYKADPSVNKNPDGSVKCPKPIHVAELMQWLLTISGCVPVDAVYCENPAQPEHVYKPRDPYVHRAQYRVKLPYGKNGLAQLDEAVCRAYLFENYSNIDKACIWDYEEILKHPDRPWKYKPEPKPIPIPIPVPKPDPDDGPWWKKLLGGKK